MSPEIPEPGAAWKRLRSAHNKIRLDCARRFCGRMLPDPFGFRVPSRCRDFRKVWRINVRDVGLEGYRRWVCAIPNTRSSPDRRLRPPCSLDEPERAKIHASRDPALALRSPPSGRHDYANTLAVEISLLRSKWPGTAALGTNKRRKLARTPAYTNHPAL